MPGTGPSQSFSVWRFYQLVCPVVCAVVLKALFAHPGPQIAVAVSYGFFSLYVVVGLGLFRGSPTDAIVTGTWLAAASGLMWYFASAIPLIWPDQAFSAAACNMGAALAAAGSAAFLVPDDKLPLIRRTFGLG